MRISDWSSDVCSSDLLLHQPTEHLIGRAERLLEEGRVAPPVDGRPVAQHAGEVGRLDQHHAAVALAGGSRLGPGGPEAVDHHVRVEAQPEGRAWRSEEHTSELQSLMRISYAVFCLKKQKTHLNTFTTIL